MAARDAAVRPATTREAIRITRNMRLSYAGAGRVARPHSPGSVTSPPPRRSDGNPVAALAASLLTIPGTFLPTLTVAFTPANGAAVPFAWDAWKAR